MLVNINDLFATVANSALSDAEAEALIDAAVLSAAEQIRTTARQKRCNELFRQNLCASNQDVLHG